MKTKNEEGMKKCAECQKSKDLSSFHKNKRNKDKHRDICKDCVCEKSRQYYINNKDEKLEYQKSYYLKHKDEIKEKKKTYAVKNKSKIKEKKKRYYEENKETILEKCKEKYHKDRDHILEIRRENNKKNINKIRKQRREGYEKQKDDIHFKLSSNIRKRLGQALRGNYKAGSAVKDLGCSIEKLKIYLEERFYQHLETGNIMSWENYGRKGWHIDHIKPLSSFDLTDRDQFLKACHYTNLQPLWAEDNYKKGNNVVTI